jgi:hypothetical protein
VQELAERAERLEPSQLATALYGVARLRGSFLPEPQPLAQLLACTAAELPRFAAREVRRGLAFGALGREIYGHLRSIDILQPM